MIVSITFILVAVLVQIKYNIIPAFKDSKIMGILIALLWVVMDIVLFPIIMFCTQF